MGKKFEVDPLPAPDLFKSNDYIKILQIKKQMTLNQQKIFDAVLSTVQEMSKREEIDVVLKEGDLILDYDLFYSHIIKGSRISKINRKDLESAMKELVSIVFSWANEKEIGSFVLFQKGVIDFQTKKVKITFGKDFRTENLLPSANYTSLSYEFLNKFKSQYSRLLYQYLKMLIGHNLHEPFRTDIKLEISFLFNFFGITEETHSEYVKNSSSFMKRCIEPARREINLHTELNVEYEIIKKGRNIDSLHFFFTPKDNFVNRVEVKNTVISAPDRVPKSKYKSFKEFRNYIIDKFRGRELGNNIPGFMEETVLGMDELGYIINIKTQKLLSSAESHMVWTYFFENQERIGVVYLITELVKAKRYIGKHIITFSKDVFGGKTENILLITDIREEEDGFRLVLRDRYDFQNERPILSATTYSLSEIELLS